MEQASATFDVVVDLVLSTQDAGINGFETVVGRRQNVDDDDVARGSMPPNDVDLTRISYQKNTVCQYIQLIYAIVASILRRSTK